MLNLFGQRLDQRSHICRLTSQNPKSRPRQDTLSTACDQGQAMITREILHSWRVQKAINRRQILWRLYACHLYSLQQAL